MYLHYDILLIFYHSKLLSSAKHKIRFQKLVSQVLSFMIFNDNEQF